MSRNSIMAAGLGGIERLQHIKDPFLSAKNVRSVIYGSQAMCIYLPNWMRSQLAAHLDGIV